MTNNGIWGWKLRGVAAAVREDQYAHSAPLGTARNACPTCGVPRDMACYRLADGPFGIAQGAPPPVPGVRRRLHRRRADEDKVLRQLVRATGHIGLIQPVRHRGPGGRQPTGAGAAAVRSSACSSTTPSSDPSSGSEARSGCGMSPTTLRPALHTPAMSSTDPFGLST